MLFALKLVAAVVVALLVLVVLAGQAGLLQGKPPQNLGLRDGRLKPPSKTPNSVSSQTDLWPDHPQREYARIAPLATGAAADAAWARLPEVIARMPGASVVERGEDYLYARCSTRVLKFTDDVEFWLDRSGTHTLHVRSSSRLGRKDFGANRARVEALRRALAG